MKAINLKTINTEQAPFEWREINEIKSQYPNQKNVEVSLQKLRKKNICVWMINKNGNWEYASDFFIVLTKKQD